MSVLSRRRSSFLPHAVLEVSVFKSQAKEKKSLRKKKIRMRRNISADITIQIATVSFYSSLFDMQYFYVKLRREIFLLRKLRRERERVLSSLFEGGIDTNCERSVNAFQNRFHYFSDFPPVSTQTWGGGGGGGGADFHRVISQPPP